MLHIVILFLACKLLYEKYDKNDNLTDTRKPPMKKPACFNTVIKDLTIAGVLIGAAVFAAPASATLIGVTDIKVTSGYSILGQAFIQISEIEVFNTSHVNIANTGTATGSGDWSGSSPNYAIDGIVNLSFPNMFHSSGTTGAFFNLNFGAPVNISDVSIFGRADCCSNRDIYNLSFFNAAGTLLYAVTGANATNGLTHSVTLVNVPEPAPLALLGLGLLGLMGVRRRKQ